MNRQEFLSRLKHELIGLPPEEAEEAYRYYCEYFDDAGPEQEQAAIAQLGSPEAVAASIKASWAYRTSGTAQAPRRKLSALWMCVLGLFGVPIALPLAIAAAAVVAALLLALLALVLGVGGGALALVLFGGFTTVIGMGQLLTSVPTALAFTGGGLLSMGIGLVMGVGIYRLAILCVSAIIRWVSRLVSRRNPA